MSEQTREQRAEAIARELLKCISIIPETEIDAMEPKQVAFWIVDILSCGLSTPKYEPVGRSFIDRLREFRDEMDIDYTKGRE